jgi:2',3'-cyclic-nucleotide 2'-phosphodiesterase (5'-nucleotidase family)
MCTVILIPADDPRNPNMGGVARRASLIETIRKEDPNVLLLDAGDIFSGLLTLITMVENSNLN